MSQTLTVPSVERVSNQQHDPELLQVNIFVIPLEVVPAPAPHEDHELTDEELLTAEVYLGEASPLIGGAAPLPRLQPFDIVVIRNKPASCIEVGGRRRLLRHDQNNRRAVLRVWTNSDTIQYRCERPFTVERIERVGWRFPNTPPHPFSPDQIWVARSDDVTGHYVWTSSTLSESANNQQYKVSFVIDGAPVDPDIICGNPPPEP